MLNIRCVARALPVLAALTIAVPFARADGDDAPFIPFYLDASGTKTTVWSATGGWPLYMTDSDNTKPGWVTKHISNFKWEDITMELTPGSEADPFNYLRKCFGAGQPAPQRYSFAWSCQDNNGGVAQRKFDGWTVSTLTTPELDAGAKDPAFFELTLSGGVGSPETHGNLKAGAYTNPGKIQKKWLPANFRLDIPGLDCSHCIHVDPVTITVTPIGDVDGDGLPDFAISASNLSFEIPMADCGPILKDLASGAPNNNPVRSGTLTLLDDAGDVLHILQLDGLQTVGLDTVYDDPTNKTKPSAQYGKAKELCGHVTLIK